MRGLKDIDLKILLCQNTREKTMYSPLQIYKNFQKKNLFNYNIDGGSILKLESVYVSQTSQDDVELEICNE